MEFVLPVDSTAVDSVNEMLRVCEVGADNYAVLVPGSAHTDKRWPVERFAALADKISSQFGLSVIATGTASEKDIVESLESLAGVPVANFASQTSLAELIALLRAAKLVVSNDTGPGHIAAALDTPMVLIFGRSNPARIAPYRKDHCVAAIEPNGRGLKVNSADPKYDIKAVTVDHVYQVVCTNEFVMCISY